MLDRVLDIANLAHSDMKSNPNPTRLTLTVVLILVVLVALNPM